MTAPGRNELIERADAGLDAVLEVAARNTSASLGAAWFGRRPADALGHLTAWHDLFLGWIADHRAGEPVEFPAPGFTWERLGDLNDALYAEHADTSPEELAERLRSTHAAMLAVIATMADAELADPDAFPWTGGEAIASVAHECLGAHYDWALRTFAAAGLDGAA